MTREVMINCHGNVPWLIMVSGRGYVEDGGLSTEVNCLALFKQATDDLHTNQWVNHVPEVITNNCGSG